MSIVGPARCAVSQGPRAAIFTGCTRVCPPPTAPGVGLHSGRCPRQGPWPWARRPLRGEPPPGAARRRRRPARPRPESRRRPGRPREDGLAAARALPHGPLPTEGAATRAPRPRADPPGAGAEQALGGVPKEAGPARAAANHEPKRRCCAPQARPLKGKARAPGRALAAGPDPVRGSPKPPDLCGWKGRALRPLAPPPRPAPRRALQGAPPLREPRRSDARGRGAAGALRPCGRCGPA